MRDKLVRELLNKKDQIYIIHYSCQNLNDDIDGYSPRITSIAVLHLKSNQMSSFSVHAIAEELGIEKNKVSTSFDKIEEIILQRFFAFAEAKGENAIWLHWNMRNIIFGFEHLEHRYRVLLKSDPYHINEQSRYNISSLINHKYGKNYVNDPKMLNLMILNGGRHRDFLTGQEEVTAFKANEFVKMHKSTMCKVYFFSMVLQSMNDNELKTNNNQLRYKINELYKSPIVQVLGIIGVVGTIISLITMLFR